MALNGTLPIIEQEIQCGACVRLDDAVLEHGLVLIHPLLPPIKLHIQVDNTNLDISKNGIARYVFEKIAPKHGSQTHYSVMIMPSSEMMDDMQVPEPTLTLPKKKLILPN
jgi:hypothetical protein